MTPFYDDGRVVLHVGHVLDVLAGLEAGSVQTCVTSPPYYGLRSYSTTPQIWGNPDCAHEWAITERVGEQRQPGDPTLSQKQASNNGSLTGIWAQATCRRSGCWRGELGSEPTPDCLAWARGQEPCSTCFVCHLVTVFRAVRRVLRDDGTCWINLGSSYSGSGKGPTGWNRIGNQAQRQGFVGGDSTHPNPSPVPVRGPAYGSDGTARLDSRQPDSFYLDLCDGCRAVQPSPHTPHNARLPEPDASPHGPIVRDSEHQDCAVAPPGVSPLDVQASTMLESAQQPQAACSHCANCGACLDVLRSSSRDGRLCVRKSGDIDGIAQQLDSSAVRTSDMELSSTALTQPPYIQSYYTRLGGKQELMIPHRVALALRADGWVVRSDIVWAKNNPMPESVTDRPTKAHEYLFLLSKRAEYFYDAEAVREPAEYGFSPTVRGGFAASVGGQHGSHTVVRGDGTGGRNRRSVWHIPEPMVRLRGDLTDEQRAYVLERLAAHARRGLP